jgi:branched-chain amino acid transport system ATP-binding protein
MKTSAPTLASPAAPRGDASAASGGLAPLTDLLLDVSDLHAGYGKAEVLSGLALQVPRGRVVTVIGPNGAGKSTLLNSLMGLLRARGRIVFDGASLADVPLEERVMRGLSLVPETRELFGSMPVEDNLVLGGYRQMRRGVPQWRRAIERVYTLFPRLQERRLQLAGTLSGGERQMLAVGRALMADPKLLMLDEPSLGLAPLVVREVFRTIAQLRAGGVSILLIEQNARAALEVSDHGYVLETGAVALQGAAASLARDPRVIDTYLGARKA